MWDLIVSVPDHCLSFYVCETFEFGMTLNSLNITAICKQNNFKLGIKD